MLHQLHLLDLAAQTHRCSVGAPAAVSCSCHSRRPLVQAAAVGHSAPQPSTSAACAGGQRRASSVCRAATTDVFTPSSSSSGLGAPVGSPPPLPGGPPDGPDEFYPNFGEAVKVLREDLPQLFEKDLQWHIYREDITFRTPSLQYFTGLYKYKLLNRSARYLVQLLYADVSISTLRMWQPDGNPRQLRVRWSMTAHPRLSLFSAQDQEPTRTEAISTYWFDSKGFIYEHQVDRIIPPESLLGKLVTWVTGRLQQGGVVLPSPGEVPIPGVRGIHSLD